MKLIKKQNYKYRSTTWEGMQYTLTWGHNEVRAPGDWSNTGKPPPRKVAFLAPPR